MNEVDFRALRDEVARLNGVVATVQGQVAEKRDRIAAILTKNGVSTAAELEAKLEVKRKEARDVELAAQVFVKETGLKLQELEGIIAAN